MGLGVQIPWDADPEGVDTLKKKPYGSGDPEVGEQIPQRCRHRPGANHASLAENARIWKPLRRAEI